MRAPHEHIPAQHQTPAFYREHIRGFEPDGPNYGMEEDELRRYPGSAKLHAPLRYLSFRAQDATSRQLVDVFILPPHALTSNQAGRGNLVDYHLDSNLRAALCPPSTVRGDIHYVPQGMVLVEEAQIRILPNFLGLAGGGWITAVGLKIAGMETMGWITCSFAHEDEARNVVWRDGYDLTATTVLPPLLPGPWWYPYLM
ncbi:hypothetical protein KC318_g12249 [Hortaea werneckii]|nr:hypothetical protein KC334_g12438 [Hortaea werneckii]KAI6964310.1 hypothetical protein KC355_g12331 [Hortaea werneckii]KAI7176034.1 hypothetical protein KC324_g9955 [Hortaea werneckii]KAI7583989.1 hypothetical protein KC316_g6966 [Hortaea werneckii]KAI7656699.1 hypothetical protein KC318_g12249 [Hortaea werneckii]